MKAPQVNSNKLVSALMEEHMIIVQALSILRIVTGKVEKRRPVEFRDLQFLCRFLSEYADKIHHHAEEELLFDALAERAPRSLRRMMEQLTTQHVMGRFFVARISEAVANGAKGKRGWRKQFVASAQSYDVLLMCHICSEDHNVFPAIDRLVSRHQLQIRLQPQSTGTQKKRLEKLLQRMALRLGGKNHSVENTHRCERASTA